jgi:hypothetical protein
MTALLRSMGFRAETTPKTGDGGVDIEAVRDDPFLGESLYLLD